MIINKFFTIKLIFLFLFMFGFIYADTNNSRKKIKVFGENLFLGKFNDNKAIYNPEYIINIGDKINIIFWGAYNKQLTVEVDPQGNIFIPYVGVIHVLGIKNKNLNKIIQLKVRKIFKKNVHVYANVLNYQPVNVFITGNVYNPGIYHGLSNSSILSFIAKAGGINPKTGSFRNIYIKREGKIIKKFDLYDFLLNGNLKLFNFKDNDIIYISKLKNYIIVDGDVKRPYQFELKENCTTLENVIKLSIPDDSVNKSIIYHWNNKKELEKKIVPITKLNYKICNGDKIDFISSKFTNDIKVFVKGAITNKRIFVVKKGTSLKSILDKIEYEKDANKDAIRIYRKSIAKLQKQLLDKRLNELQKKILTSSSSTTNGATIKKEEAKLIMEFIKTARNIKPKGMIDINKDTNLSNIILEEGDIIEVPKKRNIVVIEGEVKIPGAQTYVKGYKVEDYIKNVGGFTNNADKEHILIIHQNGKVEVYNANSFALFKKSVKIIPGDSIMVFSKPNTENLQISKDITQIIYQIAVSAGILLKIF